ncbi:MAG: tetratricopeptide repeat protein [Dehalococcoidia bacterium]
MVLTSCATSPALDRIAQGDRYLKENKWDEAIIEYQQAMALAPDLKEARSRLGLAYNNRGWRYNGQAEWDQAIADLNKAIEWDPALAAAYNNRGRAYNGKGEYALTNAIQILDSGQYDPAIVELDKAIDLYTHAIADLNQAIALNPKLSAAPNNLAASYTDRGHAYDIKRQWDSAISDLTMAVNLNPNLVGAYNNRGWAYDGKKDYELAIPDLTKAIKMDPNLALAYNNRGWAYHQTEQYDLALADLNKAIELEPKLAVAYLNRGITYYYKGMRAEAIADFNTVLALTKHPELVWGARQVLALLGAALPK